jgi:hypothetical protein
LKGRLQFLLVYLFNRAARKPFLGKERFRRVEEVEQGARRLQGQRTMISNSLWYKELAYSHFSGLKS